tara:strand:+ start:400 stop:1194 length:795 start_codon:yes stop_codon:yes gene_type:complete
MKKSNFLFILGFVVILFNSCSEYQKILKSTDLDYKYEQAILLFTNEEYIKAFPLFDELLLLYRGTDKAEDVYYYYCKTEYEKGNLLSAAYHFKNFATTYKDNSKAEECSYLAVYCHYLLSPKYSLDQTNTYKALDEMKIFFDKYPESTYTDSCKDLKTKLSNKLKKKSFENAKLYYTTENYKAAIHAFNLALQEHQNSLFKEEILFLQLKSYYLLAENSVSSKKEKRIKDTIIAFNQFKNSYSDSEFSEESKKILKQVKLLRNK